MPWSKQPKVAWCGAALRPFGELTAGKLTVGLHQGRPVRPGSGQARSARLRAGPFDKLRAGYKRYTTLKKPVSPIVTV